LFGGFVRVGAVEDCFAAPFALAAGCSAAFSDESSENAD
jgi:hypothetical protein